jgi:hypothetical protein
MVGLEMLAYQPITLPMVQEEAGSFTREVMAMQAIHWVALHSSAQVGL